MMNWVVRKMVQQRSILLVLLSTYGGLVLETQ